MNARLGVGTGWLILAASLTLLTVPLEAFFVCVGFAGDNSCRCHLALTRQACHPPPITINPATLYETAIDTIYWPNRRDRRIVWRARAFLENQTRPALAYLETDGFQTALRERIGAASATELLRRYRQANTTRRWLGQMVSSNNRYLDSATAEQQLATPPPVLDSLPGILSMSSPGATADGSLVLLFAEMRSPASRLPEHFAAATFLLFHYDGYRWVLAADFPVDTAAVDALGLPS